MAERKLSELERTGRIDAEFFQKRHLLIDEKLAGLKCASVSQTATVSDGNHFSISESFVEEGFPYYRGQDAVGHFFIEQSTPNKITREAFEESYMLRSHLQQGDVLLSIVGTVGETSLVKTAQEATCSCKLAILRPKTIEPAYLAAYLTSRVGRTITGRWKRGAVQMGLLLEDMDQLPVPRFSNNLENGIVEVIETTYRELEEGNRLFLEAEQALTRELGLVSWVAPESLTYVRNNSEAFAAERLDAEHFQEANFALRELLTNQKSGFRRIGELAMSLTNGAEIREYQPEGTPYLRVGDIKDLSVDKNSVLYVDSSRAEKELQKVSLKAGDVLVSRSGSLAVTAVVEPEWSHALISSHLIRVRIADPDFDPYYVALFLSTLPGKMQIKQWSNGGVQPEINQPSLAQIVVPKIPRQTQEEIRNAIFSSRDKRQRAAQLLESTKRAVEIAIEQSEAEALAYLDNITETQGV